MRRRRGQIIRSRSTPTDDTPARTDANNINCPFVGPGVATRRRRARLTGRARPTRPAANACDAAPASPSHRAVHTRCAFPSRRSLRRLAIVTVTPEPTRPPAANAWISPCAGNPKTTPAVVLATRTATRSRGCRGSRGTVRPCRAFASTPGAARSRRPLAFGFPPPSSIPVFFGFRAFGGRLGRVHAGRSSQLRPRSSRIARRKIDAALGERHRHISKIASATWIAPVGVGLLTNPGSPLPAPLVLHLQRRVRHAG